MRTAITYYGGKLSLIHRISPLIPKHSSYIEPFFGGGSLFFSLPKNKSEIINDTNDAVITFFKVLQNNFDELKKKVDATLYSRATYKVAKTMYQAPHLFDDVQRAWSFWVLTALGFSGTIGSFSYDKDSSKARTFRNKKLRFSKELSTRLETTQIENTDALKVINSRMTNDSFAFIDPPYLSGADQGHYKGYTEQEYINLLDTLENIKGKFLLTTYDSVLLDTYVKKNNWYQIKIEKPLTAYKSDGGKRKKKLEIFTANYDINEMIKTNSDLS
jgi:DNA adenine methylase